MSNSQITAPTLFIHKPTVLNNIQRMAEKASANGLTLKPHFKTHQSAEVGNWFRKFGINAITVSSVSMAQYFADQGWDDITIGFPVNIREIADIEELAAKLDRLSIFVLDLDTAQYLDQKLTHPVHVYIEIDTGAGRSGLLPQEIDMISELHAFLKKSDRLLFHGFYSHPGHSYSARSSDEIATIHQDVLSKMNTLKDQFTDATCCIGDTPCCSVSSDFAGIDEISPGNFVYYDLMQVQIGACHLSDIAVILAAPVVAKYPERRELILHSGAVHLSKEALTWQGKTIYGRLAMLLESGWALLTDGGYLKSLSQEHGVLACSESVFQCLQPGDLTGILPVHSCLTVNLMDRVVIQQ